MQSVSAGKCILFLGAGVHYPPPENSPFAYPEEERPPLGGALAERLAEGCNFTEVCPGEAKTNLQRVALCYEMEVGRMELVTQIRNAVDVGTEPSAAVRALAELPFPLVITTNYDTLFERALSRAGKHPVVRWYDPIGERPTEGYTPGEEASREAPFVFKVHGDVNHQDSIVITDEDYIGFVLRMSTGERAGSHPIPQTFRYYFTLWPTLFVGYSLLDYNLRLLFRTLRWKLDTSERPESYSIDLRPDPLISDRWRREHGFRFIVENVWDFVPRMFREVLGREMPL
jgi:hypothetical protein